MKKCLSLSIASVLAVLIPAISHAQLYFNAAIGGIPSVSGATLETFNAGVPANLTLTGTASLETGPGDGFIDSGLCAPPYYSGSTAAYFGESPNNGPTDGNYIAVADGGSATFTFSTPQEYFGLLWGSVDSGNILSFYNGNNLIGSITGAAVLASNPSLIVDSQGVDGTAYVNITSTTPFSSVVATFPNGASFEFDDVAYSPVPEPSAGVFLATALGCIVLALRWGFARLRPA